MDNAEINNRCFWRDLWLKFSMIAIGVISTIGFIRVNYFDADLTVEGPGMPKMRK